MARPTYSAQALVIRKTKLGESDLIVTCLADSGRQLRLVAKGARKPQSTFSSRLELFSHVKLLAARGKNLDIVSQVKLLDSNSSIRGNIERSAAASSLCELLYKSTQLDSECPHLYAMSCKALRCLSQCERDSVQLICIAALIKAFSFLGFQPQFECCVHCGRSFSSGIDESPNLFSFIDGGLVCTDCKDKIQTISLDNALIKMLYFVLYNTFEEIENTSLLEREREGLLFCQQWCKCQLDMSLKSLNFFASVV